MPENEWLSSFLLAKTYDNNPSMFRGTSTARAIVDAAAADLLRSRARRFTVDAEARDDTIIPAVFWDAIRKNYYGDCDWTNGLFKIENSLQDDWRAFGVEFNLEDLLEHFPQFADKFDRDNGIGPIRRNNTNFNTQHFYAAAKVAIELQALTVEELDSRTNASIGEMIAQHYAQSNFSPPGVDNRDKAASALRRAIRENRLAGK